LVIFFLIALSLGSAEVRNKEFKDSLTGMDFVFVKGGCYEMGEPLTTFFRRSFTTDFSHIFLLTSFASKGNI
jgi:hypothetical protein